MLQGRAAIAAATALFSTATALATPEVLVVQRLSKGANDFNVPVAQRLVEELDIEGRVVPIQWSMVDPVFRAYIDDGKLPGFVENPDDKTIREYAARLKVAYVLVIEAVAHDAQVVPQANLYQGARTKPLWSMVQQRDRGKPRLVVIEDGKVDEEKTKQIREKYADLMDDGTMRSMTVLVNGLPDWDSTAASLARTWTRILAEGPFRELEPQHRIYTPPADPGLGFQPGINPVPNTAPEVERAMQQAKLLAADGKIDEALIVLRDAIDAAPFSSECRLDMARLLIQRGSPEIAAIECERGAAMTDRAADMWALAADAWVQADEPAKALNAANEALARGAASFELLRTLADASLLNDDVEKALQYYDQALAMQPDARALFGRSLARAIAGDLDGSAQDLEKAQGDQAVPVDRYQRAMDVLAFEFDQISEKLKTIPMAVRMQGGPDMVPSAESMVKRTRALVDFLVRLRVPPRHKESHEGRDLAYKLLAQSSVEVLEFARSKNEDSAMEAAISLGEARKLVPKIGEAFRIERKYGQGTTTN